MSQNALCHRCSQLNASDLADDDVEFHPSLSSLKQAADEGCPLCSLILGRMFLDWPKTMIEALLNGETPSEFTGDVWYHQLWLRGAIVPASYDKLEGLAGAKPQVGEHLHVSVGKVPLHIGLGEPLYNEPSIGSSIQLELFVSETSCISSRISGRLFSSKHDREHYLPFIQRNLHECQTLHTQCHTGVSRDFMPTRVLDISDNQGLKLIYTKDLDKPLGYVALSYCWGPPSSYLKLTAKTHDAMLSKIEPASLSKTHRDAIQVTQGLNLRYLWIDALCILQDNGDDWAYESCLMASVYNSAEITIIAGRSDDASIGFVDRTLSTEEESLPMCSIPYSADCSEAVYITSNRSAEYGPTSTRAWCLQEDMLSRCAIIFGTEQLIYKCRGCIHYERGERAKAPSWSYVFRTMAPEDKDVPENRRKVLQAWYNFLDMISTRNLSNPHDIFGCIASLAKIVGDVLGSRYLAGIWEQDLIRGLLWKPDQARGYQGKMLSFLKNDTPATRPQPTKFAPAPVIRAPSWSWASVQGQVRLWPFDTLRAGRERTKSFDPEHAKIKPILEDGSWTRDTSCGVRALSMRACQLDMLGRIKPVYVGCHVKVNYSRALDVHKFTGWQKPRLPTRGLVEDVSELEKMEDMIDSDMVKCVAFGWFDVPEEACAQVWCLQLTAREGLMLVGGHEGRWQRRGVFYLAQSDWFESSEYDEVHLI